MRVSQQNKGSGTVQKGTFGLKGGTVSLVDPAAYREEWKAAYELAATDWKGILGENLADIEQIGSAAVENGQFRAHCKPIADLAIAVRDLPAVRKEIGALAKKGYQHLEKHDADQRLFFVRRDAQGGCTHHIYVVREHSEAWNTLRNFRDYLAVNTDKLRKYDSLKQELAEKYSHDLHAYNRAKAKFVQNTASEANDYFTLGQTVTVSVTNPIGPGYPVNYGYQKELFEKAGQKQMVYVLGVSEPVSEFTGTVIAIVKHENAANKLVVAPEGVVCYEPEIAQTLSFKEGSSNASYCCAYEKSCGAVLFVEQDGERKYLLIKNRSFHAGFPKGHVEYRETELDTVRREILEETGLTVDVVEGFRRAYEYKVKFFIQKTAVYLLAQFHDTKIVPQEGEVLDYWIVPLQKALALLEFDQDRKILQEADAYLSQWAK